MYLLINSLKQNIIVSLFIMIFVTISISVPGSLAYAHAQVCNEHTCVLIFAAWCDQQHATRHNWTNTNGSNVLLHTGAHVLKDFGGLQGIIKASTLLSFEQDDHTWLISYDTTQKIQ